MRLVGEYTRCNSYRPPTVLRLLRLIVSRPHVHPSRFIMQGIGIILSFLLKITSTGVLFLTMKAALL